MVVLLVGGDKSSQKRDIKRAVEQFRADVAKANEALDDLKELKTIAKEALGIER